jgi:hypothetical protein
MDSSSKHSFQTLWITAKNHLHSYVAPVTHNSLKEAKALNIAHTMLGNFCHSDEDKELHMENMGNKACVVVGSNNMVGIHQHIFLFQDPIITLTNHKPT